MALRRLKDALSGSKVFHLRSKLEDLWWTYNRIIFRGTSDFHTRFRLCSLEHQLVLTDQLEVHFLELPKYRGQAAMLAEARPVEKWAYFLRHADELDIPQINRLFRDPVFVEAGGILEMISNTPDERLRYELRMKAWRDQRSNLEEAEQRGLETGLQRGRLEGRQAGLEKGRWIGTIQTLQGLLGEPISKSEDLETLNLDQLEESVKNLQNRL